MAKRHKKHRHEDHTDESWLIPYADILTLLLALFIVLFASSTVDAQKLEQMSQVFSGIFDSGEGVMEYNSQSPEAAPVLPVEHKEYLEDQKALEDIQKTVEAYIEEKELDGQFNTRMTDEGLLITIRDSVLFDPGKAAVKKEYEQIAKDVSKLLEFDPPRSVVVTGHTDNVPMNTAEFASNWDLSVMRAVNFLKLVIENKELDPRWFSAKGYGEFSPVASNDNAEGRAQNRRVEILVQPLVEEDGTAAVPIQ